MNKTKMLNWGKWIAAHGAAWALASWLGFEQPIAEKYGGEIANWAVAGILVILSIWDSYKGRAKVAE